MPCAGITPCLLLFHVKSFAYLLFILATSLYPDSSRAAVMKSAIFAVVAASASRVAAHAIFQDLWINGVDQGETCVRMPTSNNPLTDVTNNNIRCNINRGAVAGRCAVKAGDTVSVEMHQQIGDRSCTLSTLQPPAIGGAHWGPVHAYLTKVSDARTADGSTPWFKIFANTWSPANNGAVSDPRRTMD